MRYQVRRTAADDRDRRRIRESEVFLQTYAFGEAFEVCSARRTVEVSHKDDELPLMRR